MPKGLPFRVMERGSALPFGEIASGLDRMLMLFPEEKSILEVVSEEGLLYQRENFGRTCREIIQRIICS